jgi:UDPglucose 6-dehydrogenase
MKKVAVIGTGYVGLVAGTCFAETGNDVVCVDIDQSKVEKLSGGTVTIYEPGLEVIFKRNLREERLCFTTDLEMAVLQSDIIFLALPTPPDEDGSADLKYVLGVAEQIGKIITSYKVIVNKSTVPVGTAKKVSDKISENASCEFDVVSNPEFLREGVAVDDFLKPDRVVIGSSSERALNIMKELYEPFVRQGNPIITMDEPSAEMTKYTANSMLALRISFMNEIANLCDKVGANVDMVRRGIGTDFRIGKHFLYSGVGYGGSCFPKDVKALIKTSTDYDYDFQILKSAEDVNQRQKHILVSKMENHYGSSNDLSGKTFAVWGLAFKPNTDDIREAPALVIIDDLVAKGAKIKAYDPEAMDNVRPNYEDKITFCDSMYEVLDYSDALIIVTEWNEFRNPNFDKVNARLNNKLIFDGRNVFDPVKMKELGYTYISIGRPQ